MRGVTGAAERSPSGHRWVRASSRRAHGPATVATPGILEPGAGSCRRGAAAAVILAPLGWWGHLWAEPFVVLETVGAGAGIVVAGDEALADAPACPASTFKAVIALAALEAGVAVPSSRHRCADAPGGGSREIDMREAMRHSSNDYFLWLAGEVGKGALGDVAARAGFFEGAPPPGWIGGDPEAVVRGGTVKVTPRRVHDFTVRLMRGSLASRPEVRCMLEEVLAWPSGDAVIRLCGKTGAWGGAAWFTGFADRGGERRAITVMVAYPVPDWRPARERAIALFLERTLKDLNLRPSDP